MFVFIRVDAIFSNCECDDRVDRDELALAALPKKGKAAVVASCKVSNDGAVC